MKKQTKIILITSGVLSLGAIATYLVLKSRVKEWTFTDNTFTGSGNSSSNLGFIGNTKPPFSVGDKVVIKQNDGAKYKEYDGETEVEYIFQNLDKTWVVDVKKQRLGDTPVNGGIMKTKLFKK